MIEVVSYWQQLPKNKLPGLRKPGANTSYDHLCNLFFYLFINLFKVDKFTKNTVYIYT